MQTKIYQNATRALALFMAVLLFLPLNLTAASDRFIMNDPIANTYTGRPNVVPLISGLSFGDMPASLAIRDAIVRGGALGVFMPQGGSFNPDASIPRAQAITYILRAAGLSDDARELTEDAITALPDETPLNIVWNFAYLQFARDIGMITAAEYTEALESLTVVPPPPPFTPDITPEEEEEAEPAPPAPPAFHEMPATRQEIAYWLYIAFEEAQSGVFNRPANQPGQSIFQFNDRYDIAPQRAHAVDAMVRNGIITGMSPTMFGPNHTISRTQLAQIIRNMDTLHFEVLGLTRVTGTVGEVTQEQFVDTLTGQSSHRVYARRADGQVDLLTSTARVSPSPQDGPLDVVVLRHGAVGGLTSLQIGDQIEYLVHAETNTVWYIHVLGEQVAQTFTGRLQTINAFDGHLTFADANGRTFTYQMIYGMYGLDNNGSHFIRFGSQIRAVDSLPLGSFYTVTLVNNLIVDIQFVGDPLLYEEIRGIVVANNPNLGYLVIIDETRRERAFNYVPGALRVTRRDFYDMREAGWNMQTMAQDISVITAGDIVSFRTAPDDPLRITHISAAAQTTTRYGRIREFRPMGNFYDMLMEFPNGQTAWFTLTPGVPVMQNGMWVSPNQIRVGDWAQIRVNQAMLGPGVMMEAIREMHLDTGGHHISTIIMGQLSRFNPTQNQLHINNARELTPAGWSNNQPLAQFNIGNANTRYYFDGQPVTRSFMANFLQRGSGTVYMALENNFAGERVAVVSVRSGRDELLRSESVIAANDGTFHLLGIPGGITTDPGTIVIRDGRLVEPHHISADDWAQVALSGHNTAAVVDISQAPSTSGIQIIRGRVQRVEPMQSFRVASILTFDGLRWHFSPIAREFTIDHDTIFMMGGAIGSIYDFIGFTDASVVDQMFNVIVDGGRAAWVIDMPWTEPIPSAPNAPGHLTLRGTIFEADGGGVSLRDVTVLNPRTGAWMPISLTNPTAIVAIPENSIIIDRDELIPAARLQIGQQISVFTATPLSEVTIGAGMPAIGYIILVES